MSVHRNRYGGWDTRWRDETGRPRQKTFKRFSDAELLDADITRAKQLGPRLMREISRGTVTLDDFVQTGFRAHALANLSANTRGHYAWALENHLQELLGEPLYNLDVPRLVEHQNKLLAGGRTPNTVREVLADLSGILTIAVEHGLIPGNPVRGMRKVPLPPTPEVRPLEPAGAEAILAELQGPHRAIALLAWQLGCRPQEAQKAPWSAFNGHTLTIGRTATKATAARTRVIDVPATTAAALKRWRLEAGRPGDDAAIIGDVDIKMWTRRHLRPAAKRAGVRADIVLYTLRHSHASALHYCGYTPIEAAARMGHSPQVHLSTYAHVLQSLGRRRYDDLDALFTEARESPPTHLKCGQSVGDAP